MSSVNIFFFDKSVDISQFLWQSKFITYVDKVWGEGKYKSVCAAQTEKHGVDAAEEVFDISNNPSRSTERNRLFGFQRSICVGDIVKVDEELFLCMPVGWQKIQ